MARTSTVKPVSPARCDLWPLFPGACQEVKGEAPWQLMRQTTDHVVCLCWLWGRRKGNGMSVVVRRWCCSAHTGNEVSSCVVGVAEWPLCAFWPCGSCTCGFCGHPVASQHFVGNGVLEAQDDTVVGMFRLLPSGLVSGPLRRTLPALAATPLWYRKLNWRG